MLQPPWGDEGPGSPCPFLPGSVSVASTRPACKGEGRVYLVSQSHTAVPSNPQSGDCLWIISRYFLLLWALKKNGKSVEITLRLVEISTSQVVLVVKNPPAKAGDARDAGSTPGPGRSPGGGLSSPLQYSCLENPHGQRNLVGYSPWGRRVRQDWATKHSPAHTYIWLPRWLSEKESAYQWIWSLGWEDPLEKEMATRCIFLSGESSRTEEPGGLQSKGSQRVQHD